MKRTLIVLYAPMIVTILLTGCGFKEVKSENAKAAKESTVSSSITVKPEKNATSGDTKKEDVVGKDLSSSPANKTLTKGSNDVNPITNNPSDSPRPDAGYVTVNPKSPYPDYCELLAKYMNQKFDTSVFKHITIEDLQMYAKQTDPKYEYGEVTLNVEHVKGKASKYQEGKNKLYIRFEIHPDGSKNFDAMDFKSFQ